MNTPRTKSKGADTKLYLILALVILGTIAYASWPTSHGEAMGGDILQALMRENDRLRSERNIPIGAPLPCNCDRQERALKESEAARQRLQMQVSELEERLAGTGEDGGRAVDVLAVPSCAHQKLEFLRWQKDEAGRVKSCPFTPENYENWEKMPPFCDYISIECLGKDNRRAAHVFGFGGPGLMIGYADVLMWEFVFARHQRLKDMVELGTMTGGTSLYWGMTANVRGGTFHTFDIADNRVTDTRRGWLPNMHFHITDILTGIDADVPSTHNQEVVKVIDVGHPILCLFDNGDKKRETQFYARYMAVGSVLLLHDWEHLDLPRPHWEMTYSMVADILEPLGFEKAYFDFAEHIGSSTRAFIRTALGQMEKM